MVYMMYLAISLSVCAVVIMCVLKRGFHVIFPIIIIFDISLVLPLCFELLLGLPWTSYNNFKIALHDNQTTSVYCLFIILTQIIFICELFRIRNQPRKNVTNNEIANSISFFEKPNYQRKIRIFTLFIVWILFLLIIISPNPLYFFQIHSIFDKVKSNGVTKIINSMDSLLAFSVVALKISDDKDNTLSLFCRIVIIVLMTLINQTRTLLMIVVGVCILIDILKGRNLKRKIPKFIISILIVILYFIYFSIISGKYYLNQDWYSVFNEYFFRSTHVRFAIYSSINQYSTKILSYPLQGFLFDLFYFVPRFIWASKPYPYITYFTANVLGRDVMTFSNEWNLRLPMGFFPEFVSSFGCLGLFYAVIVLILFCRFLDKQNLIIKLLGSTVLSLLIIYYYDNFLKIIVVLFFVLLIRQKITIRFGSIKIL